MMQPKTVGKRRVQVQLMPVRVVVIRWLNVPPKLESTLCGLIWCNLEIQESRAVESILHIHTSGVGSVDSLEDRRMPSCDKAAGSE